ncbi:MAG: hypothetical protein OXE74_05865 [Cyanobacteria bacterium MAG CAR2_bin_4]|nr:hypothetical protein [Cyanobacteria bacterium MAG CAR2_bin_4]
MNAVLRGRTLVAHVEEAFREQGLAFSFAWEPTPSNRGPSLSLSHAMGASASGGMAALLEPVVLESMAGPGSNGRQFEAQLVYGFPAANDHLILTPGLVLALAPDSSTYGLLWSVAPYAQQGQSQPWEVALEGERQEYPPPPQRFPQALLLHTLLKADPGAGMAKRAGRSRGEDSQLPVPLIRNWGSLIFQCRID